MASALLKVWLTYETFARHHADVEEVCVEA